MKRNKTILLWFAGLAGIGLLGAVANGVESASAPKKTASGDVRFNRDIRPILSENCFACHGPDPASRKEGLRLDREEGLFGDRKGGKAVIKGDAKQSLLYQRVTSDDEDEIMPPPKSHKQPLKPEQRELIRKWIEQGAPWQSHWSFIAPVRSPLPSVKDLSWVKNPIDAFVLAKLEEKGLSPAPEADRRSLIRRLSFDLTGLPPSPDEVEAFVKDESPNAYEKIVDRMMATPQYGEHRARYWLDAARYADTHGLHFDNYREMWPYREWVINAFNANLHFDQFTIEQLAGDLLPNRTLNQQIASGFNRCNETTNEGGTILEENLVFYTRDRTETTGRVWLGLTVNCAVCHDHKFDPITQREFYSMSAFFNNSTMGALDGNIKDTPPIVIVPAAQDRARYATIPNDIAGVQKQIADRHHAAHPQFDQWLANANADELKVAIPTVGLRLVAPLAEGDGKSTRVTVDGNDRDVPLAAGTKWQPGHSAGKAPQGAQGTIAELSDAGDFDRGQAFSCSVWAKLPAKGTTGAVVARMTEADSYRGWDLWIQNDMVGTHIVHHWPDDAVKVISEKPLDVSKWHYLCVTYDGSAKASGVKIYVDGELQKSRAPEADSLKGTIKTTVPFKIGQRNTSGQIKNLMVEDLRLYGRALPQSEVQQLAKNNRLASILAKTADERTEPEKKDLYEWWLATDDQPFKDLTAKKSALEAEDAAIKSRGAETLVMQEKPEPAKAFVLFRGEYDKRRDPVVAATPISLPPFPKDAPLNRLGFAQWLLRPENPLTARVTVNRFWQELYGTGIVKTSEDFGIMGESPSHPELLDYLAVEFQSDWDVKRLFKMMVMSNAYRQAAILTPEKLEKDPANRLLSRGPRYRLDGEVLRDSALAVSGLLVSKIGGPSVRPYQPPGVWSAVAMPESNTRNYVQDKGENLYRRSMYTFWKRAAPPPSMEILNAPTRETCTVRRELTDTPLQALVTMNDPQFVEAARNLAEHALKGAPSFEGRLDFVARRLLSRPTRPEESAVIKAALDDQLSYYKSHVDDAKKLLEVGETKSDASLDAAELAAWTMLVNQMMNMDEVLNK
jgi:hypothetical protein